MLARDPWPSRLRQQLRERRPARSDAARPMPAARSLAVARGATPRGQALSELLDGAVASTPHGDFFLWEDSLCAAYSDGRRLTERLLASLARAAARADEHPAFATLARVAPERMAWIDLETTGLHGRPLFMIGTMRWEGGDLVIRQTFARDYSEESALLAEFRAAARGIEALVSFNGKCFDWPFLRDRMIYHRLRAEMTVEHVDLLHLSRRRFRGVLPDCRLQTLERHLCRRVRRGDIPGHEIPQRYHEFVHTRDPRLVAAIFHHNRLDLITMAELMVALLDSRRAGDG
jgi:uncharacterized protein YprB with RNaseH-like and TPR domain